MTPLDLDAISERYREHWGLFEDELPRHGSGRAVVCLTYPQLPPFPSLSAAADWACVDKAHLWRSIRDGVEAAV